MATSPTQLTLKKLQKENYPLSQVVEKWNSWGRVRVDLFGIKITAAEEICRDASA